MNNKLNNEHDIIDVLIAEDSLTQAENLKYILEKYHYNVIIAKNGQEALEMIIKQKPTLLISDIIMPEMNGYDLCKAIKSRTDTADIPVILLTSLSQPEDVLEGISCGADHYLTKPFREDALISRVEQILANSDIYKSESVKVGVKVFVGGKSRFITVDQKAILTLLISTYEEAVGKNTELLQTQNELRLLNERLEEEVEKKTMALRESESSLKESQILGKIGSWEYDIEKQTIFWSDETYELYERDVKLGPPSSEEEAKYYSKEQLQKLRENSTQALKTGQTLSYDLEASLPSGKIVYFHSIKHPIKNSLGRVIKLNGTVQDITDIKRAEKELIIVNKELIFQNEEKEKRATELIIANKELVFQNEEKEKRATELIIANKELVFQNEEKEKRAIELSIAKELQNIALVKYKTLFDCFPHAITITDDVGKIIETNSSAESLLGVTKNEQLKRSIDGSEWQIIHPDKTPMLPDEFAGVLALREKRKVENVEMGIVKNNNITTWIKLTAAPMPLEGYGVVITYNDITEQKQAEQELIRLRLGTQHSSDAIFMTDILGVIQYINPAFENIYGYNSVEAVGKTPRILKSGKLTPLEYKHFWETLLSKKVVTAEIINKTKDGRLIFVEVSNNPILDEQGNIIGFMGIHRDITLRKQSEEKEKSLEAQLHQSQKLESIGTLASGIAHDFNNVLGIILGHSSLLELLKENPRKLSNSIEAISNATKRGASLVKQLLTFARKSEVLFEVVNINEMIVEIKILLQQTVQKTITISRSLQKDLPTIVADASQMHQVLLNLCVNARDAMPNGGTIVMSTCTVQNESIHLQFPKATERQYVKIEVTDTGIGMDEATCRRIFEPFFTTKDPGKGTGLGLSVVFGIVEHHKGFIDVRSVPGKGTSFIVYLPIPERAPEDLQPIKKNVLEILGGSETILIIEDEKMLSELVKDSLISKGYTVLTAEDGLRGVEMYQNNQEKISVVLSDFGLPGIGGQEVFRKIREINPNAKMIIASGFIEPDKKVEMYNAGLKNFIQKPYLPNEVLQKIREAIDTNG